MYITYTKLWKLLLERGMTRTDLMNLTGLSSRVMAKLTRDETVTTDTVARICAALQCDVGDIMAYTAETALSPYQYFRRFGEKIAENEQIETFTFTVNSQKFVVHATRSSADKHTLIHCRENGTVYWEQLYPLGGGISSPSRTEHVLIKPQGTPGEITVLLIKGRPGMITGLDEGIFTASRSPLRRADGVFVMSEPAFKLFVPPTQV
ncbi:MAG: helix-turn-helix transcriptional regulator [Clostridia bacterium]|nr:helix-turn-helix transcriptional regulator [Clostridia bacterium]